MGAGVTLAVLGAILTFAVRADPPGINLHIVGVILMIASGIMIYHASRGRRHERVITRVREPADPSQPKQTVRETIEDRDID
ncbi:MAG TPA: hypothetical protein VFJ94_01425 [Intrasporangium sp.]|uniref:hypothetical protein n=1 Tax=Intrasporangium sp. TaxID=1925024 RepID=UPI002D78B3B9|nr:hypothetical protein [Intrasporangium sp.]HET7397153.1 hypothetical protein [Intrasporangium sp.]